ncbi:MAG: hypothetical protein ACI9VM_000678, partial [Candidatus Azotimanducaceae bacterium]
ATEGMLGMDACELVCEAAGGVVII